MGFDLATAKPVQGRFDLATAMPVEAAPVATAAAIPPEAPPEDAPALRMAKNYVGQNVEPGLNILSSMVAAPVAGLAGIGASALRGLGADVDPGNVTESVNSALTYEPRTEGGKRATGLITYPFRKLAEGADWAGGKVSEKTGSPALGAAVNTAIQFLPALIAKGAGRVGARAVQSAKPVVPPEARAQAYVAGNTSLDWGALSDAVKSRLTDIAKQSGALERLDPKAVERQARLESLPVPVNATRGQLTRDPVQLRNEGSVSATEAGKPLRETYQQQTRQLLQNLDVLKGKVSGRGATAATAETPEQVGQSVQDAALREKLKLHQKKVKGLYELAESKGELQGDVTTRPLAKLIEESPDLQHLGWVDTWLKKADIVTDQKGAATKGLRFKASLKELEDLRQAAVARAMNGGTEGYYAGKVIGAIDQATDGAGGSAYKSARAARKAQAMEFEEQGGVARLVENKSRTDRATALEDTWRKTVLGGSIEDLRNVKRSLLTGGEAATRTAGKKAWNDLRAQTIQHIVNEATKSVTRYEDGTPNVTPASMEKAIRSVGPDKLNEIFGPQTTRQLHEIMEATRDLKTEPPTGFKGSPTFANLVAFLEKGLSKVPVLGDTVTGAVRGISKLHEIGRSGREVKQAQRTPLDDGMQISDAQRRRQEIARALKSNAGVPTATQQQR